MKKDASQSKPCAQLELLAALKKSGHTIERFKRKGGTLTVLLTPANRANDNGYFSAMEIADAMHLPSQCRVYAAEPQSILILTVELPADGLSDAGTANQEPSTKHS